jgi:hypothetical protein
LEISQTRQRLETMKNEIRPEATMETRAMSRSFNAVGIFRPTNFQNSICAASSRFKVCRQLVPLPAAEWRKVIAHGATVGKPVKKNF